MSHASAELNIFIVEASTKKGNILKEEDENIDMEEEMDDKDEETNNGTYTSIKRGGISNESFSKSCSPFRSTSNLIENKNYATATLTLGRRPTFSGHSKPSEKTDIKTYASTGHLAFKLPDPVYESINDIKTPHSTNTITPYLNKSLNYSQSTNTLTPHSSLLKSLSSKNLKNSTLSILEEPPSGGKDCWFDQVPSNSIVTNNSSNNQLLESGEFYEDNYKNNSLHKTATFSHCGTLPLSRRNRFLTNILDNTHSLKRGSSMRIKDEEDGTVMSKSSIEVPLSKNDGKDGKNLSSSKSFRDKLSKSFFDLTHGSQDRLQRWKTKLQSGKKGGREKDSSCPPPKERVVSFCEMPSTSNTSLNSLPIRDKVNLFSTKKPSLFIPFTGNGESNKNPEKMHLNIRPLHTSKSLNNAIYTIEENFGHPRSGLIKSSSFREPSKIKRTSSSTNFDNPPRAYLNISLPKVPSREGNLTILDNHFQEDIQNIGDKDMEHRTLRVRDNNAIMQKSMKGNGKQEPTQHEKNMKSLHDLVRTIESYPGKKKMSESEYNLPPPARIMPYSGIKPQDNAIIRPIAFRPIGTSEPGTVQKHFSITKTTPKIEVQGNQNHHTNMKVSPNSRDSYASAIQDNQITNIVKGNPPPYQSTFAPSRPKPINNSLTVSSYSNQKPQQNLYKEENDYDTVAEYVEKDKVCSDGSETYAYLPNNMKSSYHVSGNMTSSTHSSSMKSIGSRSPGSNVHLINQPQITPSPSDSGIVDYETLIKDKENELNNVRQTMEQNEEILIRVYQEKEKSYRHELGELKQKLRASQQGENALRCQLQKSEEEREHLNKLVTNLQNEKLTMNKKCSQIEKELYAMRSRIQDMAKEKLMSKSRMGKCDNCQMEIGAVNGSYNNSDGNEVYYNQSPPKPAPRLSKEVSSSDKELRNEVDALRSEISILREQLFEQFGIMNVKRDNSSSEVNGNNGGSRVKTISNNSFPNQINGNIKKPIISSDRLI